MQFIAQEMREYMAELGFKNISVEPVVAENDATYAITEADLTRVFDEYERFAKEYINADYNFFHFMIDLEGGPCAVKRLAGCGAGCEYLAITPEGDIYPCHQFVGRPEFLMGNIHNKSFNSEMSATFAKTNVNEKTACKNCWAKFFCSGGCHANAQSFSGDINGVYEIGCEMQKKRIECALYVKAKRTT